MVSIDLDNIIHYHHPPFPKPPCKPRLLTTFSHGPPHPPSNQLVLIHRLPPRPPCLSHESTQICHPCRQSLSPAASSLPHDRDAYLNEFDTELANLEMAEFGSQETPGSCSGGYEEIASHNNGRYRDDVRVLSEDLATPRDTAAPSDTASSDLSTAASAPACFVGADGSVSLNEPCPVQDQRQSPNPSIPVPAGDEPGPANQRLSVWSPETGAEPRKSSPLPVTDAHSIELLTRDLSATRDSNLPVRSEGDIHSTDCYPGDEAVSSPILPVLQEQKQAVSRPEGMDSPRDLSRSCSVSVVVPGKGRIGQSPLNVDSDDPDDSDYTDGNDSGVGDIAVLPRLRKRPRRTASTKIQPAQTQRESRYHMFSSPAPEEEIANPCPNTSLQNIQTIPIRGFLTRETFLSRVIYSCTFEEDRQPSCQHGPTKAPAYGEGLDRTGHTTQPSNKKPSAHATRFLPSEDELLIELKEKRSLPWNRIVRHFPGRTKGALQVRYSTKLKDRGTGNLRRGRSGRVTCPAAAAVA
ncbi:hypothetical protein N7488_001948 [Penicillium malachiteum]|nr:hypothetical protein N7488_001948 [Penicillium malachiteum]